MASQQPHAWPLGHSGASPSDDQPPPPPAHRIPVAMSQHPDPSNYSDYSPPGVTPGSDNMGDTAPGGGINGIAQSVADANQRESGIQATRGIEGWRPGQPPSAGPGHPMGV